MGPNGFRYCMTNEHIVGTIQYSAAVLIFKKTTGKPQTIQMKTPMLSYPLAHGINRMLFDLFQAPFLQVSN